MLINQSFTTLLQGLLGKTHLCLPEHFVVSKTALLWSAKYVNYCMFTHTVSHTYVLQNMNYFSTLKRPHPYLKYALEE